MENKISCREGVYGGWKQSAEYLPKAGVKYIELRRSPYPAVSIA